MIRDKYRTIYIQPFSSTIDLTREIDVGNKYKIYRPGLETEITKTLTNKFLFDGNIRPADMDTADLELKGELVEFRRDPLRYSDNDEIDEYRLSLVVNLYLRDKKENKLLWEEKTLPEIPRISPHRNPKMQQSGLHSMTLPAESSPASWKNGKKRKHIPYYRP